MGESSQLPSQPDDDNDKDDDDDDEVDAAVLYLFLADTLEELQHR